MCKILLIGTLGILLNAIFASDIHAQEEFKKYNVLFIAVDDLRPELGCYGKKHIESPNIDRLAQKGLLFLRAYCQQAICAPSRISLLSGMRCESTGIYGLETRLIDKLPDIISLPHHFKNHGYETVSIGKIYHHNDDDLDAWSTQPSRAMKGSGYITEESLRLVQENRKINPAAGTKGPPTEMAEVADDEYSDGKIGGMAITELRRLKDKPFFLAVGFRKPHLPFTAPKKYWNLYEPDEIQLAKNPFEPKGVTPYTMSNYGELRNYYGMPKGKAQVPDDVARHLIHGYYACVSYIDALIGQIINELVRLNLDKNTIIVLWGDHGWKLGEHGGWCKHTNFEIDVNAPLIVSIPEMKTAGEQSSALIEFVDIYPTLCDLAGLPKPTHLEGTSFTPLLKDPNRPWKKAAFSLWVHKKYRYNKETQIIGYTMRTKRFRYTEWIRTKSSEMKARELYDHQMDPDENVNLIENSKYSGYLNELELMMKNGWKAALPD